MTLLLSFLPLALALAAAQEPAAPTPPAAESGSRPPHILLVIADDLGWADVGFHGGEPATPTLDRLAREGVVLDRFYVHPVCRPTRAALFTGRHPARYGLGYGATRVWDPVALPPEERILPQYLRAAGYRSVFLGKWHLGHSWRSQHPSARGFDHFYGCLQSAIDHQSHEREGAPDWQRNGTTVREEGHATDLLAAEAVRLVEAHDPAQPLFLCLSFTAPHTPLEAPEELVKKYAKLGPDRGRYCAMVEHMDAALATVLAALERRGMARDTLLWFASDNGGSLGEGGSNAPLNGGKRTPYEGGIRVPALVHWPARLRGGQACQQVIAVEDVLPTLAAAAGLRLEPPQPLDGRDVLPQLLGGDPVPREDLFFAARQEYGVLWFAVIRGEWKLVNRSTSDGLVNNWLYRLDRDPEEKRNVAAGQPEKLAELAAALAAWRAVHDSKQHVSEPQPRNWKPPKDWADLAED